MRKVKNSNSKPTGFSVTVGNDEYEKFWVDIQDLRKFHSELLSALWYNALIKKDYLGFQYMRSPM